MRIQRANLIILTGWQKEHCVTQAASMADTGPADQMREAMADRLIADGMITSPAVEAAFRAVPRHLFVPAGTSLDDAYDTNVAPITKKDENGAHLSSVSAPWLQARMIAQAGVARAMRVLEIGSGGYNAALLAEVTGDKDLVVTMDIDPEVTARASAALEAAGYGDRVTVVTADGGHGMPERAPYDTIVVTAGAWDMCAARRPDVYPVQPGGIRRYIPGSDGLPESERCREQAHARKPAGTVKASKVGRWETRVIWRKLHCLNPNLQSM